MFHYFSLYFYEIMYNHISLILYVFLLNFVYHSIQVYNIVFTRTYFCFPSVAKYCSGRLALKHAKRGTVHARFEFLEGTYLT